MKQEKKVEQTPIREQQRPAKIAYARPAIVEQGTLTDRTLNSETGADSESFIDNIVWGN